MITEYPYPNPFYFLRLVLLSLDAKNSNKKLDDLVKKWSFDRRELSEFIEKDFHEVINKYMGPYSSRIAVDCIKNFIDMYLIKVVGCVSADGVSREKMLTILVNGIIKDHVSTFMRKLHEETGGPALEAILSNDKTAVKTLFEWMRGEEPGWHMYLSYVGKEDKDMIYSWIRGDSLPSSQSILLIDQHGNHSVEGNVDWQKIKILLFIARAIDWAKKSSLGKMLVDEVRLSISGTRNKSTIEYDVYIAQQFIREKLVHAIPVIHELSSGLTNSSEKDSPENYRKLIIKARKLFSESKYLMSIKYMVDHLDARWHVYSGSKSKALELYESAFEGSLFRSGKAHKLIVNEALVVAASSSNPDRVFLKKLKWSLINFGYDIPSATSDKKSSKFSENIEDWEVMSWKSSFNTTFPKTGLFPGVEYKELKTETGHLVVLDPLGVKPDYRNPDRQIKVGVTWKRKIPQLVWFALNGDIDVCKKLLAKGASVNCSSEVGDTPVLMALQLLNAKEVSEPNDTLFYALEKIHHDVETINKRTQKLRLLPIISAVESGRVDVVKAVLSMGANPNARGKTDEQTPLYVCLGIIGELKAHDSSINQKLTMSQAEKPEFLDAIRRQTHGLFGATLDGQKSFLYDAMKNPDFIEFYGKQVDFNKKNMSRNMSIEAMRKVARVLIDSGSDVNAEHASPIKGYTPFLLAAELDEREVFSAMLSAGGDVKAKYKDPRSGRNVSIMDVVRFFKANEVENVLNDALRMNTWTTSK